MYQTDFTPEELKARRQKLCDAVDQDALILIQGADGGKGSEAFRQYNEFYYLCGIEVPHSYLVINSADARATLFLPRESQLDVQEVGEVICADSAKHVCDITGVDETLGVELLAGRLQHAETIYTPFEEGQLRSVSIDTIWKWRKGVLSDPWDGGISRAARLVETLKRRLPQIEIKDLLRAVDELRYIKSDRELDLLRHAGHLTALAVKEAMRSTRHGVIEYQLDAVMQYNFLVGGAADRGYFSLIPSGANICHPHYCGNQGVLTDGDWVLCDGAPDYHYYTSDIGRMWPINGKYSPEQRSLYGYVVEFHKALLQNIRAGKMLTTIQEETDAQMRPVFEGWEFLTQFHQDCAERMFGKGYHLSHNVGMTVHDTGFHRTRPLEPGVVFAVDPILCDTEQTLYVRVEDTVVVTETGIENLTSEAPLELDDVEAMMREDGLLQAFPPA